MQDTKKVRSRENELIQDDFAQGQHQVIFTCIYNLGLQGIQEIGISELENYLALTHPVDHNKIFEQGRGEEWVSKVLDESSPVNYLYYFNRVKKFSLLRNYIKAGIDVSDILDMNAIDPKIIETQQLTFNELLVNEIIHKVDKRVLNAKHKFIVKDEASRRKAGDDANELYEKLQNTSAYGLGLESEYINSITRGAQSKKFFLETRDTGAGKTRIAIRRLLDFTAPQLWSHKKGKFVSNPQGINNSALYIGTEMDLYEELEPMMWAIVSGVEEDKIKDDDLTTEEKARVMKAIDILADTQLFMEDEPNFNVHYLRQIIEEYKVKYDICAVGLDYIELNSALIGEFTNNTKGMGVREDQILLELSSSLKNISKEMDVFIMAFTQTTDEARRDGVRDQRAVKGARSLPNKADVGVVVFEPTVKELDKLEKLIKGTGLTTVEIPNICYSFYKNRGGKHKKVKVWGVQNLGNMEYHDLFCTDDNYKRININPTAIQATESKPAVNSKVKF